MAYLALATVHRSLVLLSALVLLALVWRYVSISSQDPYRCNALLTKGQWVGNARGPYNDEVFRTWQPDGCMLHEYDTKDIANCVGNKRILFVGDSTMRQLFWATAKKLDKNGAQKDMANAEKDRKHTDLTFSKSGVDLEFIWDAFINTTRLHNELDTFRKESFTDEDLQSDKKDAALIVIGGGLWHARDAGDKGIESFKNATDAVVPFIGHRGQMFPRVQNVDPPTLRMNSENLLLFSPVQVPDYKRLSPSRAASIRPETISAMNDYLLELSSRHGVEVMWSYLLMTWQYPVAYEESGLHVVENVATRRADIFLNMRCNGKANLEGYPHDRTCCASYRKANWQQLTGLIFALVVMPFVILLAYLRYSRTQNGPIQQTSFLGSHQSLFALFVFTCAVCYCYEADRTWLFEKSEKAYSHRAFYTLCGLAFAVGTLTFGQASLKSPPTSAGHAKPLRQDLPFLSRSQTDEWKGWMQVVVLIYHYLGASKVLWIYEIIRLLVAAYLFMTGFGHAVYFYKSDDYSLRRVASTLFRLNLLACVLPYVMRTDYLFYYFAPLVSFWFVVIYFTMKVGHSRNRDSLFLFGKIVISAVLTTSIIKVPGVLETIFRVLQLTCHISWDVQEWRFRIFLDMFIVYIGMVVGILYTQIISASQHNNRFIRFIRYHFVTFQILAVIASLIILPGFWLLTRRSPDKYDYNWWQPYISCLPILSYIVLRNCHRALRNRHSRIFAWLGRCSLETFTLQFHIWMAADTKGLLSLGLFTGNAGSIGRWVEFVIITIIFLWVSWGVAASTNVLAGHLIRPNGIYPTSQAAASHARTKSENMMVLPSNNSSEVNGFAAPTSPGSEKKTRWSSVVTNREGDGRLGVRSLSLLGVLWILNWTYT